ncbi:hypothetical protein J1N35_009866 [Gossypium stocksii]|uniref:Zinc knuckle CX2CX4HX4C domain-containing protein n=1 Tax=Gossypium stocksii TaxID=47602 RepID=A0A9D3W1C9_9ROSI|nr:hypothetical protein J1N35_009866 [Gossypium stocksii]
MENYVNGTESESCTGSDQNTKKVRFKKVVDGETSNMVMDSDKQSNLSFKDKLLGGGVASSDGNLKGNFDKNDNDFELMDGDVNMSMVNGIPAIAFSDSIKGLLFKKMELTVILKLLGLKLDLQTDNRTRGRFACLVVFINLNKPLVSQVLVDGTVQRVEFEALPMVCFSCGKYGHVKELYPSVEANLAFRSAVVATMASSGDKNGGASKEKLVDYGLWMSVERKSERGQRDSQVNERVFGKGIVGIQECEDRAAGVFSNGEAKVSEVARGIEVGLKPLVGPDLDSSPSRLRNFEKGRVEGKQALGKKPMESDMPF